VRTSLKAAQGDVAAVTLNYGKFIQTVLDFLIVAWAVFLMVKGLNTLRRKAAPAGPEDPELAKLPEQFRANAKMALAQFEKETDVAKLKEGLGQMEAQADKVPPQVKPMIEFLMQKLRARIQKLEAK